MITLSRLAYLIATGVQTALIFRTLIPLLDRLGPIGLLAFALIGLGTGQLVSRPSLRPFALMWLTLACLSLALYPSTLPLFWLISVGVAHGLLLPKISGDARFTALPVLLPLAFLLVFPPGHNWAEFCLTTGALFAAHFAHNLWAVLNPLCPESSHS
ncbi:MAG: hypothetical protein HYR96_11080 [Deltaproteobacteria bacterium]|nr:hypothetical protein [Deltaproteobacteria bacterium]MBI3293985.1 hypothetical protein [Deltaproteobacteria bacterium]